MRTIIKALSIIVVIASTVSVAHAGSSIGINFGVGGQNGVAGLAPTDVAGVVPQANWNNAVGDSGTSGGLIMDNSGSPVGTAASVTWFSGDTWNGSTAFTLANKTLMDGYLDGESGGTATATISGLAGHGWNVYIYSASAQSDNKQSGGFFVNSAHLPLGVPGVSNYGPTFVQTVPGIAGNYLLLNNVFPIGGVITIRDDATNGRIPFNGLQLVDARVPEPSTLLLLGLGLGGLWMAMRRRHVAKILSTTAVAVALVGSAAHAAVVSVNFVGAAGAAGTLSPSNTAGNPNESALVPNWNNATGTAGTINNLSASDGPTFYSVTYSAPSTHLLPAPATTTGSNLAGGQNPAMMKGYLDYTSASPSGTIAFSGLKPIGATYTVLVYFDGDNGGSWRGGGYTLSGATTGNGTITGEDSENVNFNSGSGNNANGLFQLPVGGGGGNQNWPTSPNNNEGNYVKFLGVSGSSFTLTPFGSGTSDVQRAPVNGIQILGLQSGVPEPSTLLLLGTGLGAITLAMRRRRAK